MNLTTLEQSKLLKEWGAPQDTSYGWPINSNGLIPWNCKNMMCEGMEYYASYDLESLIEWLGEDFTRLIYHKKKKSYFAQGNVPPKYPTFRGKTPLEAVFNLAKAIHGGCDHQWATFPANEINQSEATLCTKCGKFKLPSNE